MITETEEYQLLGAVTRQRLRKLSVWNSDLYSLRRFMKLIITCISSYMYNRSIKPLTQKMFNNYVATIQSAA
jgi:hypothetical protein